MRIGIDARVLGRQKAGTGYFLSNILKNLARMDQENQYYLYCYTPINLPVKNEQWQVRPVSGISRLLGTWRFLPAVRKMARQDGIDVFWGSCHVLPRLDPGIKTVLTIHDLVHVLFPHTMRFYNQLIHSCLMPRAVKRADVVVSVSGHVKEEISQVFGPEAGQKTQVIQEGVDREFFRPLNQPGQSGAVLKKYGIYTRYILSVGTLEPRKNYPFLVKAFDLAPEVHHEFLLVLAGGKGWKNRAIYRTINGSFAKSTMKVLGYVAEDDLPVLYNNAALCVFPSQYEGFGLPVLEALACGAKVLVPDLPWARELLGDGDCYYKADDGNDLGHRLRSQLDTAFGIDCDALLSNYRWDTAAAKYLDIFKGLVGHAGK